MKTLLKSFVFASLVIFFAIGCQKILSDENSNMTNSSISFNAKAAKEWYYNSFVQSADWKSTYLEENKLPDWKNAVYSKMGDMEIVEFPLFKEKTNIPIPSNNSLTVAEKIRIANASLTRVIITKDKNSSITIQEVDYIPDWEYLLKKQFDISKVSYGNEVSDFTGKMILKKWDGVDLSIRILVNGRITKTGKIKKLEAIPKSNNTANVDYCENVEICLYTQYCSVYPDGYETCGPWNYMGICYLEEHCVYIPDPEVPPGGEVDCQNWTEAYATSILSAITSQTTTNQYFQSGAESASDANGIIRKPVAVSGVGLTLHLWGDKYPNWNTNYTGVVFKTTSNSTWKWESFAFSSVSQTSGTMGQCMDADVVTNISTAISGDKLTGLAAGNFSVAIKCICIFGVRVGSPWVTQLGNNDEFIAK